MVVRSPISGENSGDMRAMLVLRWDVHFWISVRDPALMRNRQDWAPQLPVHGPGLSHDIFLRPLLKRRCFALNRALKIFQCASCLDFLEIVRFVWRLKQTLECARR